MRPPELRYRFHGRTPPTPGSKAAILAELPTATVDSEGTAVLRLYDPIDSWGGDWGVSAKEFAAVLDGLGDDVAKIRLHINSPGGEVFEGIAIMNLLRDHKASVTAVVDGLAASAASFLAASADETIMGRNAELMIHDAWGLAIGNAADMRDLADRLDHLSNNIAAVYAAKAGGTTEDWRAAMIAETWYSAEEAVAAGLADSLNDKPADQPKDKFDLSLFQHAGRDDAPAPTAPVPAAPEPDPGGMGARTRARHRLNQRKAA
jgi:ATP-dependent Clp endopeptidase proteolytic subunit ClpP